MPFPLVILARFLSGIVYGIVHLTVTVHTSDIGSKRMRQVISYWIIATIAISTAFYSFMMNFWYKNRSDFLTVPTFCIGFNVLLIAVLAMILTPILTNETVSYYLVRDKESKALKKFTKLKSERKSCATTTLKQFNEYKTMVDEDKQNDRGIFSGDNFKSFYIVLMTRLLHLATSNVPLLMLLMTEVGTWGAVKYWSVDDGFLTELCTARFIIGTIVLTAASWFGRHKFIYIGTILASVAILVGFLQNMYLPWSAQHTLRQIIGYSVPVAYAIYSFGVDYYQMKQSVEAFPITTKAWSLAIVAIIEQLTHAGLIAIFIHRLQEVKILIAGAIIVLSFVSVTVVPDTRKLSLRATRNLFSGFKPSTSANV